MKRFKFKLAYKVTSQLEADELVAKLKELGYKGTDKCYIPNLGYEYLVNNASQNVGRYMIADNLTNRELITNKDLFLALAAMVDDEEFYVGEYVAYTDIARRELNMEEYPYVHVYTLYKCLGRRTTPNERYGEFNIFTDSSERSKTSGTRPLYIRKATREEIESHILGNKQEEVMNKEIFGKWNKGDKLGFDTDRIRYRFSTWTSNNYENFIGNNPEYIVVKSQVFNNEEHLCFYSDINKNYYYFMIPKSELISKGILKEEIMEQESVSVTKDNAVVGLKVVRGKDWEWGNQDGNSVGTIIESSSYFPLNSSYLWVRVRWNNGDNHSYRIGYDNKFDLHVAQENKETMNNKDFTVGGNKYLRQALVDELVAEGLVTINTFDVDDQLYPYLCIIGFNNGKISQKRTKEDTHYELPQDYDKAKQAFLDVLKVPEYVEILRDMTPLKKGDICKVSEDGTIESDRYSSLHGKYKYKADEVDRWKPSTKQAYEAQKPKEVKHTITTDNGSHELIISKNKVQLSGYGESVTIAELNRLRDMLNDISIDFPVKVRLRINLGCNEQIKGLSGTVVKEVIDLHNKHFA